MCTHLLDPQFVDWALERGDTDAVTFVIERLWPLHVDRWSDNMRRQSLAHALLLLGQAQKAVTTVNDTKLADEQHKSRSLQLVASLVAVQGAEGGDRHAFSAGIGGVASFDDATPAARQTIEFLGGLFTDIITRHKQRNLEVCIDGLIATLGLIADDAVLPLIRVARPYNESEGESEGEKESTGKCDKDGNPIEKDDTCPAAYVNGISLFELASFYVQTEKSDHVQAWWKFISELLARAPPAAALSVVTRFVSAYEMTQFVSTYETDGGFYLRQIVPDDVFDRAMAVLQTPAAGANAARAAAEAAVLNTLLKCAVLDARVEIVAQLGRSGGVADDGGAWIVEVGRGDGSASRCHVFYGLLCDDICVRCSCFEHAPGERVADAWFSANRPEHDGTGAIEWRALRAAWTPRHSEFISVWRNDLTQRALCPRAQRLLPSRWRCLAERDLWWAERLLDEQAPVGADDADLIVRVAVAAAARGYVRTVERCLALNVLQPDEKRATVGGGLRNRPEHNGSESIPDACLKLRTETVLSAAAAGDHIEVIALFEDATRATPHVDSRNAALRAAVRHGRMAATDELLRRGAKPFAVDERGYDALQSALALGLWEIAERLLHTTTDYYRLSVDDCSTPLVDFHLSGGFDVRFRHRSRRRFGWGLRNGWYTYQYGDTVENKICNFLDEPAPWWTPLHTACWLAPLFESDIHTRVIIKLARGSGALAKDDQPSVLDDRRARISALQALQANCYDSADENDDLEDAGAAETIAMLASDPVLRSYLGIHGAASPCALEALARSDAPLFKVGLSLSLFLPRSLLSSLGPGLFLMCTFEAGFGARVSSALYSRSVPLYPCFSLPRGGISAPAPR